MGLRKERWKRKVYRVFEKLYFDFKLFIYLFFNIVLMWKIVGVSKVSVIYIYIYRLFFFDIFYVNDLSE